MEKQEANFIQLICAFEPEYDHGDRIWEFYPRINRKWWYLRVQEYQNTYYFSGNNFESFSTSSLMNSSMKKPTSPDLLRKLISGVQEIHRKVRKDPVSYHCIVNRSLSPNLRKGLIVRKFVRKLIPNFMRFDRELSNREKQQIVALLKNHRSETTSKMTAGIYFKYCKLAYLANPKTFGGQLNKNSSGKELYARWADGRDGGLKELPLDSEVASRRWYESKSGAGGHPWEIYRGGNSTHIDLSVSRGEAESRWKVRIHAFSSTRLAEACRIALALSKANLPFEIADRESYLLRILGDDWVGVVPEFWGLSYAWQEFPKEFNVSDCIHYSWFKPDQQKPVKPLHQIKKLITWFPIRPLFLAP